MSDAHLALAGATLAYTPTTPGGRRVAIYAHGLTSSRDHDDATAIFDWSAVDGAGTALIRYDARGHGRSTGRPQPTDYTWTALADDLLALIDVVSPDQPVDVIGASMGTATILWAALRRPDRFRRLVLSIPPTAWTTRAAQVDGYATAAAIAEGEGMAAYLASMSANPPTPILAEGGWSTEVTPPSVATALLPAVLRGAAASDLPDPAALAALTHPTLLLPWETDPGHPVRTARELHELLGHSTLEIATDPDDIRRWGHRAADFLEY